VECKKYLQKKYEKVSAILRSGENLLFSNLLLAVIATSHKGKVKVIRYSLPLNRDGRFRTFLVCLNYYD
jgi:hypothetical protein